MSHNWSLSLHGGGKPLQDGLYFSDDKKHCIALFSDCLKVFFLQTRRCIRTIPLEHEDVADCFVKDQLIYVIYKHEGVDVINWRDKVSKPLVDQIKLQFKDQVLEFLAMQDQDFFLITGDPKTQIRYVVKTNAVEYHEMLRVKNVSHYRKSLNGNKLVFVQNEKHRLTLAEFSVSLDVLPTTQQPFLYKSPVTSVAISNAGVVGLGTASGIIQVVYTFDSGKPQRLLKWHCDQVLSLEFNSDETYLMSGGYEKVLVFWQMGTEKLQFLPRLNGLITGIKSSHGYYGLSLAMNENDVELLVLSSVDLASRLNVDGTRPKFLNQYQNFRKQHRKLLKKISDVTKVKLDYTTNFSIHPITNHVYFPYDSYVQVYDMVKDEQAFVQAIAPTLQTGKVKSELFLIDPEIQLLEISSDGQWMVTYDRLKSSSVDGLLSEKDVSYSLKFWKQGDPSKETQWELSTRVVDPHGENCPVVAIKFSPEDASLVTVDNKGGVRMWKPQKPKEHFVKAAGEKLRSTAWTLRKMKPGYETDSNSISLAWSPDGSVLLTSFDCILTLLDASSFNPIEPQIPAIASAKIKKIDFLNSHQVLVLTKNAIVTFNLLTFTLEPLCFQWNCSLGGNKLMAVDTDAQVVALVLNYYNEDRTAINAKVALFRPSSMAPFFMASHAAPISGIRHSEKGFVFIDVSGKLGTVSRSAAKLEEPSKDEAYEINVLLNAATALADTPKPEQNGEAASKILSSNVFDSLLENVERLKVDSLFDRVMRVI